MWCITKSLFFCHIDLKPLGFGGSQNGTICAGSPKDSSSHWGSSPHGFIIRVGYSRFHWNIASLLFTWPFESFQGHQVDYIKLIISPITSRYYITKTPSYIIFLLPIYHFLLYANTKMSFLFGHFSGCMWSIPFTLGFIPPWIYHKSRVLPIPLEYCKPPVHMAVWIVSRASSWLYQVDYISDHIQVLHHQNPQLHYFSSAYISFFTICKYKDVLFVWAFLRLHVIHPPGYNRRPMGTGSATEPRSDATRWNSAAWSKRLRPRNRGAQRKRGVW